MPEGGIEIKKEQENHMMYVSEQYTGVSQSELGTYATEHFHHFLECHCRFGVSDSRSSHEYDILI